MGFVGPSDLAALLDDAPAAVSIEALVSLGWEGGRQLDSPHMSSDDQRFALWRGFGKCSGYFACLLRLGALLAQGLPGLYPGQRQAYYAAALRARAKHCVLPSLPDRAYKVLMLGDVVRPAASSTVAPLAQVALAAVALAQPDRGVGAHEAGSGDDFETSEEALPARGRQALARLAALARPQRSPASSNSSLESDDEHVFTGTVDAQPQPVASAGRASSAVAVAPPRHGERAASAHELAAFRAEWAAAGVPERVEGVAVRVEARVRVDGSFVHIRRRVQCSNPAHGPQCQRSRSVFVTADEGPLGSVGFLGAWLRAGAPSGPCASSREAHQRYRPTQPDVRAWLQDNGHAP